MGKVFITLHRVRFKNALDWDVNVLSRGAVTSKYDICKLSDCIVEQNQKYDISNPNQDYKILGVNNQTGVFDAYIENGSKINQKYKKMQNGWIAYNPYRVNVGSIGIKNVEQKYEYISPAYVVFSCNKKLNSEFLFYLMKTQQFNKIIRENTTGTVRQNLSFGNLKNLEIPCPILSIQVQLVNNYKDKLLKAVLLENKAKNIEVEIDDFLQNKLGISPKKSTQSTTNMAMACEPAIEFVAEYRTIATTSNSFVLGQEIKKTYKYLQFVNYADIKDWKVEDVDDTDTFAYSLFNSVKLSDVVTLQSGLFLPKNKQEGDKYNVYGGNGITGQHSEYCFEGKRIIIGRVGEYCGNVHLVDGKYWVTDNALVVSKKSEELTWEYLAIALKMLNLNQYKKQSAQPVISQKVIGSLSIPLPPLEVQQEIAAHISDLKQQSKNLKQEAIKLRETALKEFENEIFE